MNTPNSPTPKALGLKKPGGPFVTVVSKDGGPWSTTFGPAADSFEAAEAKARSFLEKPEFTQAWVVSHDGGTVEVTP